MDGLPDEWGKRYLVGTNSILSPNSDFDGDGLKDKQEFKGGLSPVNPDSNGNFLKDGAENNTGAFVNANITRTSNCMTVSFWQKLNTIPNANSFWFFSPAFRTAGTSGPPSLRRHRHHRF